MAVTRSDVVLAAMVAHAAPFTSEQLRKLLFLFDHEAAKYGPELSDFVPRYYGQHDRQVDLLLEVLTEDHLVEKHSTFAGSLIVTSAGRSRGMAVLEALRPEARAYFERASVFVRSVNFSTLASVVDNANLKAVHRAG
jgi:hypothetical protein